MRTILLLICLWSVNVYAAKLPHSDEPREVSERVAKFIVEKLERLINDPKTSPKEMAVDLSDARTEAGCIQELENMRILFRTVDPARDGRVSFSVAKPDVLGVHDTQITFYAMCSIKGSKFRKCLITFAVDEAHYEKGQLTCTVILGHLTFSLSPTVSD